MATKLDKTLKREITIDGESYTLTLTPEGVKVVKKGHRLGHEMSWKQIVSGEAQLTQALEKSVEAAPAGDPKP
jgi:hypothetical protein